MAPPKRDDSKGKGKESSSKLQVQKPTRPPPVNFGQFLNASCLANYKNYFSKRPIAVERHVHEKTLFDTIIGHELMFGGWESLMKIQGIVQEEVVQVFWSNIHDSGLKDLTFHTEVYGIQMDVDPSVLSTLLGIARPIGQVMAFPPKEIDKAAISDIFGREGTTWSGKLQSTECLLEVRLLNLIFTYNLFPTTHNNNMPDTMVHVIYSLLTKKGVDITTIMCHMIISETRNSSTSWFFLYGVLITHLLEVYGVSFPKNATTLKQGAEIDQSTI